MTLEKLLALTQNRVLEAHGFSLDALHDSTCPDKFGSEQTQAHQNYRCAGTWRKNHDDSQGQKREPNKNQVSAHLFADEWTTSESGCLDYPYLCNRSLTVQVHVHNIALF